MSFEQEENEFLTEEKSFDIKSLFPKILRIWPWILLSLFLFSGAGYLYTKMSQTIFRTSGLFFIKDTDSKLSLFEGSSLSNDGSKGLANEVIILNSRPIAEITLAQLDYDVEYFKKATFINQEIYQNTPIIIEVEWKSPQIVNGLVTVEWSGSDQYTLSFKDKNYQKFLPDGGVIKLDLIPESEVFEFGEWIENNNFNIKISKTNSEQQGEILFRLRDFNSLVNEYANNLEVSVFERGSSILNLSILSPNIKKGEIFINSLMRAYLDLELEDKNEASSNTVKFIDSQVAGVADSLSYFEGQLEDFRSENKIYDLTAESTSVFEQLTEYEKQVGQERFKRRYYQNLKDYLVRENYKDLVVPSGLGIDDPILNTLITNMMTLQVEKSALLASQTEAAPSVKEANRKINDLNASIREVLNNVDKNAEALVLDLDERIKKIESSFRNLPQTEQNLIRIQRQFTLNENIYTFLMQKRAEAAITKASNKSANKIIELASGGSLVSPIPIRNYLISLFLGLFIPVFLVIFRELIRSKIDDVKYLESKLKFPLLSTILINKSEGNLVVFDQGKSGIAEGFRSLRANIKYIAPKQSKLTLMITSTISGEGKTFCAMNLASVYSLTGKKTILVGCDMRKPKIFEDFGLTNKRGLSTILSGQENVWLDVVKSTKYKNLDILVSGPTPPNPAELLLTEDFKLLLENLKEIYDIVILDTPPIGLVSETLDILSLVDLTLFVFRQDYSQRVFIESVNRLKSSKDLKNIYAVFNGVDGKKVSYGYSYGYGYGYYSDDTKL